MAHFKAVLHETLVNVITSLLLDLLHLVFHLAGSTATCLTIFAPPLCGLA